MNIQQLKKKMGAEFFIKLSSKPTPNTSDRIVLKFKNLNSADQNITSLHKLTYILTFLEKINSLLPKISDLDFKFKLLAPF